jgi:hypothetical protein
LTALFLTALFLTALFLTALFSDRSTRRDAGQRRT